MKFIQTTENEHTKIMLDLENLTLPEMVVTADDVTFDIDDDNSRDYSYVNEFLATLTDDRAVILATGLVNMQRAVNKHEDAKECAKEFGDILTELTQNLTLDLVRSLRTFSHNTYVSRDISHPTIWHRPVEEMIIAASLLSALCVIPLNNLIFRRYYRPSEIAQLFEDAIKNSCPDGERFVNYIRDVVDTALGEKVRMFSKNWPVSLIYVNQHATRTDVIARGIAEYVICKFSKHVLSRYVLDKWVDPMKLEQTDKEAQQILSKRMMPADTLKK